MVGTIVGDAATASIRRMVGDESLTRGLDDVEGRMLVDWLVDWAELLIEGAKSPAEADSLVLRLSRRGKAISRFVQLWIEPRTRGSATQLAAVERFTWPLPTRWIHAADLMQQILTWENSHHVRA
ncbi:MAG: hypothetical protein ACRC8S_18570 [Fimbriiglobus sp.]